mgnify:CR=1 FL=1
MNQTKTITSSFILICLAITLFIVGSLLAADPLWLAGRFGVEAGKAYAEALQYKHSYKAYAKSNDTVDAPLLENKNVPVLLYHSIIPKDDGYNVTVDVFKDHVFSLKQAGYETITARQLRDFLKDGTPLPPHPVLITFDDGSKTSFYPVDPMFQALGFKGTNFIISKYSTGTEGAGSFYLSEDELRYAKSTGRWEILSHGHDAHELDTPFMGGSNHFLSQRQFLELEGRFENENDFSMRVLRDFTHSKDALAQALSADMFGYAFPFGDFGQNNSEYPENEKLILDAVARSYDIVFHQARWKHPEPFLYDNRMYMVPRIVVHTEWGGDELLQAMTNYMASGVTSIPVGETGEE